MSRLLVVKLEAAARPLIVQVGATARPLEVLVGATVTTRIISSVCNRSVSAGAESDTDGSSLIDDLDAAAGYL